MWRVDKLSCRTDFSPGISIGFVSRLRFGVSFEHSVHYDLFVTRGLLGTLGPITYIMIHTNPDPTMWTWVCTSVPQ